MMQSPTIYTYYCTCITYSRKTQYSRFICQSNVPLHQKCWRSQQHLNMSWAHAYWATKVQSLGEHSAAGKPHDGTKRLNRWGNAKYIGYSYTNTWTWNGEAVCFQKTQIMEVFLFSLQLKSSFFLWNPRKPFQPGPTKPISTGRQQNGWKTPGLATHCVNETEQDEWPQPAQCFMTERKKLWIVCGKTASHQFTALYCFYTKPQ